MKKVFISIVLFLFIIIPGVLKANPVPPPTLISELYFDGNYWYLEIDVSIIYSELDSMVIITSTDTVKVMNGLTINGNILILTSDSMESPLSINPNGDMILIGYITNNSVWVESALFSYGTYQYASFPVPLPGESLVMQKYSEFGMPTIHWYSMVLESNPSIGSNLFECSSKATITGYVYDQNLNGCPNLCLIGFDSGVYYNVYPTPLYITTDSTGYFEGDLFGKYHYINLRKIILQYCYSDTTLFDSIIFVRPDSIYNFNIYLDTLFTNRNTIGSISDLKLLSYPNPVKDKLTIEFELPDKQYFNKGLIKVFNTSGDMLIIQPIELVNNNKTYIDCLGLPSGNYYYNLELNNKKIASNKFIVIK